MDGAVSAPAAMIFVHIRWVLWKEV